MLPPLYAVIIACASANPDQCIQYEDLWGPYDSVKACEKRLRIMNDTLVEDSFRLYYPDVSEITVEGWCTLVDPASAEETSPPIKT